ncbi:MAG: hypothetical protein R6W77_03985 [Trueperaceae bacterium]
MVRDSCRSRNAAGRLSILKVGAVIVAGMFLPMFSIVGQLSQ